MPYFQKAENALKRAEEFELVKKPDLALETLHALITSRRHRTWGPTHEIVLIKYINLCIELRKGRMARDGLHQYKTIAGQTAISSLETVIVHYLQSSEERLSKAWEESRGAGKTKVSADTEGVDVDDLEESETPESVLLGAVSEEGTQDRSDRVMLTPWLKFMWEAYRTVLDILRNNAKLEHLYHSTAARTFSFCLQYERKHEFRRLCDLLRFHLQQVVKYQNQANAVDLDKPESLELHVQTRFEQLNTAAKLELWQEAYKAIEEISNLIDISKKTPKSYVLAVYYRKLSQVFWMSNDLVFHATALHRLLQLTAESKKNIRPEDLRNISNAVYLSSLAVPVASNDTEVKPVAAYQKPKVAADKLVRLALLVGVNAVPTRAELIEDAMKRRITDGVDPEIKDLHTILEENFDPLKLNERLAPIFEYMKDKRQIAQYIPKLHYVTVMRLLKQLSQVYSSMRLERLASLVPFLDSFTLEKYVVQAVKDNVVSVRVCHRTNSIIFGGDAFLTQTDLPHEGPCLQSLQSEMMRGQLTTLAKRLHEAVVMITPSHRVIAREKRRRALHDGMTAKLKHEHLANLNRKTIIENRKVYIETLTQLNLQKEQEKARVTREEAKKREDERQEMEEKKRNLARKKKERETMDKQVALEKVNMLSQTAIGARVIKSLTKEELATMDADEIVKKQVDLLEKEGRELKARLKTTERKVDYMERAKRILEIPKLKEMVTERRAENQQFWEEEVAARREKAVAKHSRALAIKGKLATMVDAKSTFMGQLMARRKAAYEAECEVFENKLARQAERLEKERKEREEREEQQRIQAAEEARRQAEKEEAERVEREAREEAEREEREKREAEEAEKREKLERMRQKDLLREQEIERRFREKQIAAGGSGDRAPPQRQQQQQQQPAGGDWRSQARPREEPQRDEPRRIGGGGGDWRSRAAASSGRDEVRREEPRRMEGGGGGGGNWRDNMRSRDPAPSRDSRDAPRRDLGADGGSWSRGGGNDRDMGRGREEPMRREAPARAEPTNWRNSAPAPKAQEQEAPPAAKPVVAQAPPKAAAPKVEVEEDEWSTVKR